MKILSPLKLKYTPTEDEDVVSKKYVDDKFTDLDIDSTLDLSSEHAIQNKVVAKNFNEVNEKIGDIASTLDSISRRS